MKNLAIIPVRAGSTRIKRKNFIDFYGKPLFYYTFIAAQSSKLFEEIIVSTESIEVQNICKELGIKVDYVRPIELSGGDVSLTNVCIDVINHFKKKNKVFDNLCLLWATSPLRDSNDIIKAFSLLNENAKVDGVIGVTEYNHSPYCAMTNDMDGFVQQVMVDHFWKGSDGWPKTFVDCGSIAWIKMNAFLREKTWLPKLSKAYTMPRYKGVDLDTHDDLELLEFYFEKYYLKKNKIENV